MGKQTNKKINGVQGELREGEEGYYATMWDDISCGLEGGICDPQANDMRV